MSRGQLHYWCHADVAFVDGGTRVVALVLTDLVACDPVVLVGSAAVIWRAVGAGSAEKTIVQTVANQFQDDRRSIEGDVRGFLEALRACGLVTRT